MKAKTSRALKEVWQMKRLAQQETQHLKGDQYFAYVRQRVKDAYTFPVRHVRFTPSVQVAGALMVSDGHGEYRTCPRRRSKTTDVKRNLAT